MASSPRPSGAESSWISKWNTSQATVKPTSTTTQLCEECLTTFKLVHRHLLSRMDLSKSAVRCYDRALGAFVLWTDGYEVLKGGLDQVMADSWTLRRLILKFLIDIGRSLAEGFMPTLGLSDEYSAQLSSLKATFYEAEALLQEGQNISTDWEAAADPDSTSDAESDRSDDSSQASMISDSRGLDELLADLKTAIQCLRDLGPLIESPCVERPKQPEDTTPVSLQTSWKAYQPYGDRILQRFPQAQSDLVERLARANLGRFQKIQEEKSENLIKQEQHGETASRISGSIRYRDSALGTSLATGSIYAETVMAYGQSDDLAVRVPPLPEGAKSGVPFECLACGRIISIKNNSAWKKHLWRDLRPWICHDITCDLGNEPFTSREDWIEHLEFDHGFHLAWGSFECPLCHEETGKGKTTIVHHLARHMEEISLAALPSGYDSDNDLEESDADEPTYCYCNGISYGEMIACDADECPREWFHLECVGLKVAPGSKTIWYCEDCKERLKIRGKKTNSQYNDGDKDENENEDEDEEGDVDDKGIQSISSEAAQAMDDLLVAGRDVAGPSIVTSSSLHPRDHDLYRFAPPREDGLYHCPWEGQPSCNHKPEKLKANYEKFVDSHLKPYGCKVASCQGARFSSLACLLRHEREAHGGHGHPEKPFLCVYAGCERSVPGNGFPRQWNLRDHLKRVHNDHTNSGRAVFAAAFKEAAK